VNEAREVRGSWEAASKYLAVRTRARGARKMTWLMATVRGREMIGELPALFFNLFQRTGSSSIGTQKGNSALRTR